MRELGGQNQGWKARKRRLVGDLNAFCSKIKSAKNLEIKNLSTEFDKIDSLFKNFKQGISVPSNSSIIAQLESGLIELYKRC